MEITNTLTQKYSNGIVEYFKFLCSDMLYDILNIKIFGCQLWLDIRGESFSVWRIK
jgi:hypothetical protein